MVNSNLSKMHQILFGSNNDNMRIEEENKKVCLDIIEDELKKKTSKIFPNEDKTNDYLNKMKKFAEKILEEDDARFKKFQKKILK